MSRRLALPAALTLLALALLIALGVWQWQRRAEKSELISTITERISAQPMMLPAQAVWQNLDVGTLAYRPVRARGTFDHTKETHVFFSLSEKKGGYSGPGYLIVTPFRLEDGGTVLVNRGFVPQQFKDPNRRKSGQVEGPVTITGLARAPERRGSFTPDDDPIKNVFHIRDPQIIAAARKLGPVAPLIIDLAMPEPEGGLPVPGTTRIDIPNNHLQYALTWWSLALVLATIFILFARRNAAR